MRLSARMTAGIVAASLGTLAISGAAFGQPGPRGRGPGGGGWDPGMMMGPGMMRGDMGFMCSPRSAGMAEWRASRIESAIKLTDEQKATLKRLTDASEQAAKAIEAGCAAGVPSNPAERMAMMEKRAEASLLAIKTVRPAFEAFYASLDEDQKKQLNSIGPRRWGWDRWRSR